MATEFKYFIVKTPIGYYYKSLGNSVVSYTSSNVNAHKYFSRKLAEKCANKINGEVIECNLLNSNIN